MCNAFCMILWWWVVEIEKGCSTESELIETLQDYTFVISKRKKEEIWIWTSIRQMGDWDNLEACRLSPGHYNNNNNLNAK